MKRSALFLTAAVLALLGCAGASTPRSSAWSEFVRVEGQPEPVPAEWVSTPEGKFAHSIKIPNPVAADSGYRPGMSSEEYFKHLCEKEAGEFVFKTVENVEGFYFMRPPKRPTDYDLMDRYKLEAPHIESLFQAVIPKIKERAAFLAVSPPWRLYKFFEESDPRKPYRQGFLRAYGYRVKSSPMKVDAVATASSEYGLIWRGLKRQHDRESAIAGGEWLVIDLRTSEVLAVRRNYGRTGFNRNTPEGIWWLNAIGCSVFGEPTTLSGVRLQIYEFSSRVIKPIPGGQK